jgi:beta-phosphoglucomutase-like phosphatase (HAD superfamily)
VAGLHVGYMDTDMARQVTSPKIAPEYVAKVAIDALANDEYEIVVDDLSRGVQSGLAGGVPALYPQLP